MIIQEGGAIIGDVANFQDMSDMLNMGVTSGMGSGHNAGAQVQNVSRVSSATAALSDQFAGALGAHLSDWSDELAGRMVQEF